VSVSVTRVDSASGAPFDRLLHPSATTRGAKAKKALDTTHLATRLAKLSGVPSLPLRISPKPTALLPLLHLHSAVEGGRVAVQGRSTQEILKELRKQKPVADPANDEYGEPGEDSYLDEEEADRLEGLKQYDLDGELTMDEEIRVLDEAEAAQLAAGRAARAAHRLDAVRPARTRSLPATPIHRSMLDESMVSSTASVRRALGQATLEERQQEDEEMIEHTRGAPALDDDDHLVLAPLGRPEEAGESMVMSADESLLEASMASAVPPTPRPALATVSRGDGGEEEMDHSRY
ncbi:hypothetical protein PRIPAC_87181, partial [Pristionchus pacificus]|uniref:Uncharacterized protein n=1 Tax=Pristionchus pacificus TaxID=54126 RepID=A0A2A6CTZ9_PRIPA